MNKGIEAGKNVQVINWETFPHSKPQLVALRKGALGGKAEDPIVGSYHWNWELAEGCSRVCGVTGEKRKMLSWTMA